ncbi:MAG: gliding motility-associated C-terminal domain-containing protein [Bacteroidia bacterium]
MARHGGGCADTILLNDIVVHPTPTAGFDFFQADKPPHGQMIFTNTSSGADKYLWHFGDGDSTDVEHPYHNYGRLGEYLVKLRAITNEGCEHEVHRIVPLVDLFNFHIPTAFSPNEDGYNEEFAPVLLNPDDQFAWKIYNRWGEVVFESTTSQTWDGRNQAGNLAPDGVYVYVLTIISSADGWKTSATGQVTLVR